MPTRRQERVAQRIVQEVSEAIRSLKDPRIGFVTVTEASITPDLRDARVRVSVLGEPEKQAACLEALQHSANHLRNLIGRRLALKVTPRLQFSLDHNIERADTMSRLIAEARASDPNPGDRPDEEARIDTPQDEVE